MTGLIVDITLLSIVGVFSILGFFTGFTGKILSISSWILAGVSAFYACPYTLPLSESAIGLSWWIEPATGLTLYIIFLIIFMILSRAISSNIKGSKIGFVDRNLGIILGAILGVLFLSTSVLGLRFFLTDGNRPQYLKDSKTFPFIELCADKVCTLLPQSIFPPTLIRTQHEKKNARDKAAWRLAQLAPKLKEIETVYAAPERHAMDVLIAEVS